VIWPKIRAASKSSRSRRRDRRRALQASTLGLFTLFSVILVAVGNPAAIERLSALVFDAYQQIRPRQESGAPIVIVDVDEASLRQAGQWPWPRSDLARIVDQLGELGAAAIGFDLVFSEPDRTSLGQVVARLEQAGVKLGLPATLPDNDAILAAAIARQVVTVGFVLTNEFESDVPPAKSGFAVAGESPEAYVMNFSGGIANLPVLTESAAGAGFFSFPPSPDGVVRVVPLLARRGEQLYPALSVELLRTAQGASSIVLRATGASGEANTGRPALTALKVGALEVPTGPGGEFRVYFSGLPSIPIIPAAALLDPNKAGAFADAVAGRIALIGSSAVGLRDIVPTPLDPALPGVLVHAEIIDQILGGTFLTRPDWAPGAEIAAAVIFTLGLLAAVLTLGPLTGAVAGFLIMVAVFATSWLAFAQARLVLDPILPWISVTGVYVIVTAFMLLLTDRERQFVRRAFGRYLSPSLVERLADDPSALSLGGETRELTVLFSDIRGFTAMSEKLDPQELTRILNRFLTPMTDVLLQSGGTIDKYIGDAIMAFWNAPLAVDDHPRRACLAALSMLKALAGINAREGLQLKIGIGLNTGPCCVGNLGSEQRFSYSAIGDAVNVAARVEGLTKEYDLPVLVTQMTADRLDGLALLEVDLVRVVGRREPLALYTLLGDETMATDPEFAAHGAAHRTMIEAYRAGSFAYAAEALATARRLAPEHLTSFYDVYEARLSALVESPPARWDGVITALRK